MDRTLDAQSGWRPGLGEAVLSRAGRGGWLYFCQPEAIISATQMEDVLPALEEIEDQVDRRGRFAAGFVCYEAAPAFDPAFEVRQAVPGAFPLLWFGLYPEPLELPPGAVQAGPVLLPASWQAEVSESVYRSAIRRIKHRIAHGHTYQVNYTYRLRTSFYEGAAPDAWSFFSALAGSQRPPYAGYIETQPWAVCSLSPEMFFSLEGSLLTSRPMKGTAQRGLILEDDQALADWLYHSEKNRAENVMIVDMVRNDLGRIARVGSVHVPDLFKIEKYPTVWQMTSTVQAETSAGFTEILRALFPASSITGAPKVSTMQIIAGLEASPRHLYTGALGYLRSWPQGAV